MGVNVEEVNVEEAVAQLRSAGGTLLAMVPVPGTGTSLAIVGYPVPTGAQAPAGLADAAGTFAAIPLPAADAAVTGRLGPQRAGLVLDYDQRRVVVDGADVPVTFQEFELLAFLVAHPGTVFSRADLVQQAWQRGFTADSRTVDVHVSRLRRKLGRVHGRSLVTEYRVGYQFRPEP